MRYPPLLSPNSQIRLLDLQYGDSTALVECSLYVVDLSTAPQYDALSYTWGDPNITRPIKVNGEDFQVTENLEAFLRQRQRERNQRPLWVDAISINQADTQEKSVQVSKMAQIYENCTWLSIWLGRATRESDLAILTFRSAIEKKVSYHLTDEQKNSLLHFLSRSWWTRVWIVQEVGFGAKFSGGGDVFESGLQILDDGPIPDGCQTQLRCGNMTIGWDQLVRATENLTKNFSIPDVLRDKLRSYIQDLDLGRSDVSEIYKPGHSQLLLTLSQYRDRQSTDPRDKIFALLRMAPRIREDIIQADYTASFDSILRLFVKREVSLTQSLNVLRYCRLRSQEAKCSWAPDWSQASPLTMSFNAEAGRFFKADVRFSDDIQDLQVKSVLCGKIRTILPLDTTRRFDKAEEKIHFLLSVHKCRKYAQQPQVVDPSMRDPTMGFWGILSGKFDSISIYDHLGECLGYNGKISPLKWLPPIPHHWKPASSCTAAQSWIQEGTDLPNNPFGIEIEDPYGQYRTEGVLSASVGERIRSMAEFEVTAQHRFRHMEGRKVFITDEGCFGLGPSDAIEGDSIAVFLGAEAPFVLRSQGIHYELIGETYIQGLMLGERTLSLERGEVSTCEIILR